MHGLSGPTRAYANAEQQLVLLLLGWVGGSASELPTPGGGNCLRLRAHPGLWKPAPASFEV